MLSALPHRSGGDPALSEHHGHERQAIPAAWCIGEAAQRPSADEDLALHDIWLLRLYALLARAHDNGSAYAQFRDHYHEMAKTLGFEGHIAWAEAMP